MAPSTGEPLFDFQQATLFRSFRDNVDEFVQTRGTPVTLPELGTQCWFVPLLDGSHLHIYAEEINEQNASCDQCRIIGWGHHPVSCIRFHFIIPAETGPDSLEDSNALPAIAEACHSGKDPADAGAARLPTQTVVAADATVSPYNSPYTVFDSTRHRLHGVVHANGFGHLLRVNGRDGGSRSATGTQIVDLWDGLCQNLRVRSITVEDVSNKAGMELRILYKVARNITWYGGWGYEFGRGSYNISEDRWRAAAVWIYAASLKDLLHDFEGVEPGVEAVVRRYFLPVVPAVRIRRLGDLVQRLLYLQENPGEALRFFDPESRRVAEDKVRAEDEADAAKRSAAKASSTKSKVKHRRLSFAPPLPASRLKLKAKAPVASSLASYYAGPENAAVSTMRIKLRTSNANANASVGAGPPLRPDEADASRKRTRRHTDIEEHEDDDAGDDEDDDDDDYDPGGAGQTQDQADYDAMGRKGKRPRRGEPNAITLRNDIGADQWSRYDPFLGRKVRAYVPERRMWSVGVVQHKDAKTGFYDVAFGAFSALLDLLTAEKVEFVNGTAGAGTPKPSQQPSVPAPNSEETKPNAGESAANLDETPDSVHVGDDVRIYNEARRAFRNAHVIEYLPSGLHKVRYPNGTFADFDFAQIRWQRLEKSTVKGTDMRITRHQAGNEDQKGQPLAREGLPSKADDVGASRRRITRTRSSVVGPSPVPATTTMQLGGRTTPSQPTRRVVPRRSASALSENPAPERGKPARHKRSGASSSTAKKPAPSKPAAAELPMLRYKAVLAREDVVEKARQLSRALRMLIPASRMYLAGETTRGGLEAGFAKMADKEAPKPAFKGPWFEYIPALLRWAQETVHGSDAPLVGSAEDASLTVGVKGDVVEIDRAKLQRLGLFPHGWTVPLKPAALVGANAEAAASVHGAQNIKGKTTVGDMKPERNRKIDGIEASIKQSQVSAKPTASKLAKDSKQALANGSSQVQALQKQTASLAQPIAADRSHGSLFTPTAQQVDPTGPLELPSSDLSMPNSTITQTPGLPSASFRPPWIAKDHPWPEERILVAASQLVKDAGAHEGGWLAPQRLVSLATAAINERNEGLVRAALLLLGNRSFDGWDILVALAPNGGPGVYYSARQMGEREKSDLTPSGFLLGHNGEDAAKTVDAKAVDARKGQEPSVDGRQEILAEHMEAKPASGPAVRNEVPLDLDSNSNQAMQQRSLLPLHMATTTTTTTHTTIVPDHPALGNTQGVLPSSSIAQNGRGPVIRTALQQAAIDAALAPVLSPFPAPLSPTPASGALVVRPNGDAGGSSGGKVTSFDPGEGQPPPPLPPARIRPWMHLVPGGDLPDPANVESARQQITRDLHHIFSAVFKVYSPAVANSAAESAARAAQERPAIRSLKLRQLPAEVQVLRDTKHFVKHFAGIDVANDALLLPPVERRQSPQVDANALRIWCKLQVPEELSLPHAATRHGRKELRIDPPPEFILLESNATLTGLLRSATHAYRRLYCMTSKFTATHVVSGLEELPSPPHAEVPLKGSNHNTAAYLSRRDKASSGSAQPLPTPLQAQSTLETPLASLLPKKPIINNAEVDVLQASRRRKAAAANATSKGAIAPPSTVTVAGIDLDVHEIWLHAGGPEDWIVACVCGTRDDDGEAMVACERCNRWMHTRCVGYVEDAGEAWVCKSCLERQGSAMEVV